MDEFECIIASTPSSAEHWAASRVVAAAAALDAGDGGAAQRIIQHLAAEYPVDGPAGSLHDLVWSGLFIAALPAHASTPEDVRAIVDAAYEVGGPGLAMMVCAGALLLIGLRAGWLPEFEWFELEGLARDAGLAAGSEIRAMLARIERRSSRPGAA